MSGCVVQGSAPQRICCRHCCSSDELVPEAHLQAETEQTEVIKVGPHRQKTRVGDGAEGEGEEGEERGRRAA